MTSKTLFAVAAFAGIGLAAFATSMAAGSLAGSEWGFEGQDTPYIQFNGNGQVSGNAGCNRFFGPYVKTGSGGIAIGPVGATKMACPQEVMEAENAFFSALAGTADYERNGTQLRLVDSEGRTLIELVQRDAD